jgi:Protein of unknown function (DUF2865)
MGADRGCGPITRQGPDKGMRKTSILQTRVWRTSKLTGTRAVAGLRMIYPIFQYVRVAGRSHAAATATSPRRLRRLATAMLFGLAVPAAAAAQGAYSQPAPGVSPVCGRLEAQLAAIDRGGGGDPARADQARRLEDALGRQQAELDRTQANWQRLGCQQPSLFSIFANQSPQCGPLNGQIAQMRANIDRTNSDLQRTRHGGDDEMQRQAVLGALGQNNCGPQYRAAAAPQQRGFFETIFGGPSGPSATAPPVGGGVDYPQVGGSGYRTLCVRTCDGFYFPISYSTSPGHFAEDEQACHQQCPASEALLYSHRNPGEDVSQAVSISGRLYKDLPNAFRYRKELTPACTCRQPGQSWADALGQTKDTTVERGDIVVTDEKAKAMAQPRPDPQSRTSPRTGTEPRKSAATMPAIAPTDPPDQGAAATDVDPAKRTVRPVGPTFIAPPAPR